MQAETLDRYGAPIAIIAGALMIDHPTRDPLHHTDRDGHFKEYVVSTSHAVNSAVSILTFVLL